MRDKKVLKLRHKRDEESFDIVVEDIDKTNMLDVFIELLEGAPKKGLTIPSNPSLFYIYESKSYKLERDKDLLEMFRLLHDVPVIKIVIGSAETPCEILELARGLVESRLSSASLPSSNNTMPSGGFMDETHPTQIPHPSQLVPENPILQPQSSSLPPRRVVSFNLPFHQLKQNSSDPLQPTPHPLSLQISKIPPTTARRKGIFMPSEKSLSSDTPPTPGNLSRTRGVVIPVAENTDGNLDDLEIDIDYEPSDSSANDSEDFENDQCVEDLILLPCVDDGYDPEKSSEWGPDKESYFDRLYENGEFNSEKHIYI